MKVLSRAADWIFCGRDTDCSINHTTQHEGAGVELAGAANDSLLTSVEVFFMLGGEVEEEEDMITTCNMCDKNSERKGGYY